MTDTDPAQDELTAFFNDYGAALSGSDLPGISGAYEVPGLVLADQASIPITSRDEIEHVFAGATQRYRAEGLVRAQPDVTAVQRLTDKLVLVSVRWAYQDDDGVTRQRDAYRYLVRRLSDGRFGIHVVVATPADA